MHWTPVGADASILKYTGNLTDDLTISALYGENRTKHVNDLLGYSATVPGIVAGSSARAPGYTYNNPQPFAGQRAPPTR